MLKNVNSCLTSSFSIFLHSPRQGGRPEVPLIKHKYLQPKVGKLIPKFLFSKDGMRWNSIMFAYECVNFLNQLWSMIMLAYHNAIQLCYQFHYFITSFINLLPRLIPYLLSFIPLLIPSSFINGSVPIDIPSSPDER